MAPAHVVSARFLAALTLLPIPLFACECDPGLNRVAPQIYIDACARPQKVVNGKDIGGYEDCVVDFASSDIAVRAERTLTITNPSHIPLNLLSITIEGDPNFALGADIPTLINPGLSVPLVVAVRPVVESAVEATLVIISDANNTPQNEDSNSEIRIPLKVVGVDNGVPNIQVSPALCDFGRVATGGVKECILEISNTGTRELYFDFIDFIDAEPSVRFVVPEGSDTSFPPFGLTGSRPRPDQPLRPTGSDNAPLSLRVIFGPDVLGDYAGKLLINSSDPDNGAVEVPLTGTGVIGPNCVARVKSVNDVDVTGAPSIQPLDDVMLTLEDSTAADAASGSIAGYEWTLQALGGGSTVILSSPNEAETGFLFANRRGIDVAGRFVVSARVFDDLGTASTNDCRVEFESVPQQSFLVQLSWATPSGDMDLHVTRQNANDNYCVRSLGGGTGNVGPVAEECGGEEGEDTDCYYGNCGGGHSNAPEWDGEIGRTLGDPSLDIDDTSGYGPENINVDTAVAGSYLFGVTTFSSGTDTPATMRLYLYGQLSGEWTKVIRDEFWEVGIVHWPVRTDVLPCVEDLNDGVNGDQCSCVGDVGNGTCDCWEDLGDGDDSDDCAP